MANTGVQTTHPDYDLLLPTWRKLRAVAAGRDALIAGRTTYLPAPTKMDALRYSDYLCRAKWFGATKRTVQAFEGLAFRQPLSIQVPASVTPHLATLTSTGVPLQGLARLAFREALLMGRYGVLVDMGATGDRPFWAGYPAESILNWSTDVLQGQRRLTRVTLAETSWVPTPDGFGQLAQQSVRILQLVDGLYTQTLYTVSETGVVLVSAVVTARQREPLDFLPFVFVGVNDLEPSPELSALNDLVETNLAYWRHSADYEWSLHLTASPTPWITGHDASLDVGPDGTVESELILGSDTAIVLREADARVGMLEFQGHGLEPQRQALTDDKLEMASLGARLLEGQPQTDETLGAAQLRHIGDTSVLTALAGTLSMALTQLLRYHAFWFGAAARPDDPKVTCMLPTNFSAARLSPQAMTALLAAVQAGHISQETFYYNLRQGDIAEPGITFEMEQARLEAAAPALVRLRPGAGGAP